MASRDIEDLVEKPEEPLPGECCGSGCARCVWDLYFERLAHWERKCVILSSNPAATRTVASETAVPSPTSSAVGSVVLKYFEDGEEVEDVYGVPCPLDAHNPLWRRSMAPVAEVRLLSTSSSTVPSALMLVELRLLQHSGVPPDGVARPGEVVELFVPNNTDDVARLCQRLDLMPDRICQLDRSPYVAEEAFPSWLPQRRGISVRNLLRYYVDISSSSYLRRPYFALLEKFATAPADKAALGSLVRDGPLAQSSVLEAYPSMLDTLSAFPSTRPPLAKLLEVAGPLRPRSFSVVAHTQKGGEHVVLLLMRHISHIRGLVASVPSLMQPSSSPSLPHFYGHISHTVHERVSAAAGLCCRFPASSAHAFPPSVFGRSRLVLIGAGSGVAPLLSLLKRSSNTLEASSERCMHWLLFGCKLWSEAELVVGHPEMRDGTRCTDALDICLSQEEPPASASSTLRDAATSSTRCTVWKGHLGVALQSHREEVQSWFHHGCAVVACGPSRMLTSIRHTLSEILFPNLTSDDDDSIRDHQMRLLEKEQRVIFEDWSTGKKS